MSEQEFNIGKWLSAALDDDSVCAEMKHDITRWFDYVERKDKELEALRKVANVFYREPFVSDKAYFDLGLIDKDGNPTKLLKGE